MRIGYETEKAAAEKLDVVRHRWRKSSNAPALCSDMRDRYANEAVKLLLFSSVKSKSAY